MAVRPGRDAKVIAAEPDESESDVGSRPRTRHGTRNGTPDSTRDEERAMDEVRSKDGTRISCTTHGRGPVVVLVGGGLDDGGENSALVPALSEHLTVVNYARRGRGASGGIDPTSRALLADEVDDLAAVVAGAGGRAHAFGASSGGALVLEAAAAGVALDRIVLWEVPYAVGEPAVASWRSYVDALHDALGRDDRETALGLFMQLAGSPPEVVDQVRTSEHWPRLLALAPTLAADAACLGDGPPPAYRLAGVVQSVLVLTGPGGDVGSQDLSSDFMTSAADAIVAALPAGERRRLAAGGHQVDPEVLAPVILDHVRGVDMAAT
jgi:hypothetical protein